MRRVIRKWSRYHNGKMIAFIAQTATSGLIRVRGIPAGGYQLYPERWLNEEVRIKEHSAGKNRLYRLVLRDGSECFVRAINTRVAKSTAKRCGKDPVSAVEFDESKTRLLCDF